MASSVALYESVLDGVYESMPSLPGLVLTARLLNRQQKREDTPENSFRAISEMTALLCSIDLAILEKKHFENTTEAPKPPTPKRSAVASRAEAQLTEVTDLDKRLRAANESLKAAMDEQKRLASAANAMLGEFNSLNNSLGGLHGGGRMNNDFGGAFGAGFTGSSDPWLLTIDPVSESLLGLVRQFTEDPITGERRTPTNSPFGEAPATGATTNNGPDAVAQPAGQVPTPPVPARATEATETTQTAHDSIVIPVAAKTEDDDNNESKQEAKQEDDEQNRNNRDDSQPPRPARLRRARRIYP